MRRLIVSSVLVAFCLAAMPNMAMAQGPGPNRAVQRMAVLIKALFNRVQLTHKGKPVKERFERVMGLLTSLLAREGVRGIPRLAFSDRWTSTMEIAQALFALMDPAQQGQLLYAVESIIRREFTTEEMKAAEADLAIPDLPKAPPLELDAAPLAPTLSPNVDTTGL